MVWTVFDGWIEWVADTRLPQYFQRSATRQRQHAELAFIVGATGDALHDRMACLRQDINDQQSRRMVRYLRRRTLWTTSYKACMISRKCLEEKTGLSVCAASALLQYETLSRKLHDLVSKRHT